MERLRRRSSHGLSLVEGLVAGLLALVLGVLIWKFIASSLGAHRKSTLSRSAQSGTRELIGLLVGELRSAAVPPLVSPSVSTPVFWPGVWGRAQEGEGLGDFFPREETVEGESRWDLSSNRVLYVRVVDNPSETTLDPLARYALVELLVPEERPGTVERRVHTLTDLGRQLLQVQSVQGADSATRRSWLLSPETLLGAEAPETPDTVFDAGPDSRVAFRISHRDWTPPSDPGRTRNPEIFDPAVFRVEVVVAYEPQLSTAVNVPWPVPEQWDTLRQETTELRIPSVRGN